MDDSQFNIERATNGLVLALYLAAAVFLAVMLYYVLRDIDERQPAPTDDAAVLQHEVPWKEGIAASEAHVLRRYIPPNV
jgi:HAMP domain-containing protein